ncbi:hypothetical protein [Vibrio owensii]|uniref:hypothetical protein n=1 Tax=Vibrio owensii TaxID=696485 RepID=UPI003AAFDF36
MKAWLYKDFWWWFSGWVILLITSLFVYSYNEDLGSLLLRFTGTIIVALLTAMAAFDHMNTNERKKQAREQYLSYSSLLYALDARYQNVRMLREQYVNLFEYDNFLRGISPPYSIMRAVGKAPELTNLSFLKKAYTGLSMEDCNSVQNSAFNIPNLNSLFSNYDYLIVLIERRNEIFEKNFVGTLDKYYMGNGEVGVSQKALKDSGILYSELAKFLMLTESIMAILDALYYEIPKVIDELNDGCKDVLDSEIAKENYGYPTLRYPYGNDGVHYRALSIVEMQKMHQRTYSSNRDYRQRFF